MNTLEEYKKKGMMSIYELLQYSEAFLIEMYIEFDISLSQYMS